MKRTRTLIAERHALRPCATVTRMSDLVAPGGLDHLSAALGYPGRPRLHHGDRRDRYRLWARLYGDEAADTDPCPDLLCRGVLDRDVLPDDAAHAGAVPTSR